MAAAAAAARKPANSQEATSPSKFPHWFARHGGWFPSLNGLADDLVPSLTGTELRIMVLAWPQ